MHGARATIVKPRLDRRVVTSCTSSSPTNRCPSRTRPSSWPWICCWQLPPAATSCLWLLQMFRRLHEQRNAIKDMWMRRSAPPEQYTRPSQHDLNHGPAIIQCAIQPAAAGLLCRSSARQRESLGGRAQPGSRHDEAARSRQPAGQPQPRRGGAFEQQRSVVFSS